MIECRLCGCKFDEDKAELLDCNCGCGGNKVMCPNCGYEVRLPRTNQPRRFKKQEEMGLVGKIVSALRMDG